MANFSEETGRIGVHECGLLIERMGFIFREQLTSDYGIDAIIETRTNDYASGKMIAVQIKSGDSYFKEIKDDFVIYRGEIKHFNYWLNHSLPVIIVLYSPTSRKCIWQTINKQTAKTTGNGWKIRIPFQQELEAAKYNLQILADNQSEYQRRWSSLVVAKEWMLEAKERGSLILEVQEWINKSSGRGTFILKTEEDDGCSKTLFSREMFGFGSKKYELVIKELFPWANVEVDDEFYENNIEEDCYSKRDILDRMVVSILGKKDDKLLKYSDVPQKLYPYRNGAGEVDFYRLKLTLNQVGESFLNMENFLETGKGYFIDNFMD
ncbi:hypothetical protein CLNEO_10040 [Anaerotignum neopropionicum]|uniref:DUF4365 domain-containing protein n=1 Tax=Anaerotignum neopropionicum TaxID=36847 RepID=A0A136WGU1_9FIRM|nr:DUF4365 domain-containing protein [Anaerotignum neopropionicum]KXL53778.1 hypothetical protein CLNEO_10040 [Anaerotignum neopropionicum]